MREDLDDDEYEEGKTDTLKQMEEFEQSLSKMMVFITFMSGEPNLTDEILLFTWSLYYVDRRYDLSVRIGCCAISYSGCN